jgi:hypothetical protein
MMDIGTIKGVMINGTTRRVRVYGTKHDIGFDFNAPEITPAIQDAMLKLQLALAASISKSHSPVLPANTKVGLLSSKLS